MTQVVGNRRNTVPAIRMYIERPVTRFSGSGKNHDPGNTNVVDPKTHDTDSQNVL
jgi:hypothetical protein